MKDEQEIIREFIRESLLVEDGASFRRSMGAAVGKLKDVAVGEFKNVFAAVKQLAGITFEAVKEVGSLGLFKANYDKVKENYQKNLQEIDFKYGYAIRDAREKFDIALGPLESAAQAGLGATALAFFAVNPLVFIAAGAAASAAGTGIKKAAEKGKEVIDKAEKAIDKMAYGEKEAAGAKEITNEQWVKDAKADVLKATESYYQQIKEQINKVLSASKIEDLGLPAELVKKLQTDEKNKQIVLKASKGMALNSILSSVKQDKQRVIDDAKKAGLSDKIIYDSKSYIKIYDKLINEINAALKSAAA